MAYIQRTVPPPNKIVTFSLRNFAGGMNNRSDLLRENEAHRLLNMKFLEDELMVKRDGTEAYDRASMTNSPPVTFIDEYEPYNDANQLVYATSSTTESRLYIGSYQYALSGEVTGVNFNGKYFVADGTKLYVFGKFPQSTSTYEAIVGTPVNDYTLMEVVTPPSYTPLGTTHVRGVTRYDYTSKKVWYEPCQLELDDTYKGANVVPEKLKYLLIHNGRLFASGSSKDNDNVFPTDVRNPYYFPVAMPIQLPPNSDEITGMIVYDDSVLVSRKQDIYVIQGVTNNPNLGMPLMSLRKLNSHTGVSNHKSMNIVHNYLFFVGSDGVMYSLSSANQSEKILATSILSRQLDIFQDPFLFTKDDIKTSVSYFHDGEWFVSIQDKVLVYSYHHRAWTYYGGLNARSFYNHNGKLIWGNHEGKVITFSDTGLDLGVPFEAYWTSKMFDMDDANAHKQFREFFIVAHTFNEKNSDIRLTFEIDYVDVNSEVVIQNQIAIWGKSRFGERFITRNINASLPFVIGRRGRGIRFTFTNGYTPSTPVANRSDLDTYLGIREGLLVQVTSENAYYVFRNGEWVALTTSDLDQKMKIYQINGEYEYRGKR